MMKKDHPMEAPDESIFVPSSRTHTFLMASVCVLWVEIVYVVYYSCNILSSIYHNVAIHQPMSTSDI